MWFCGQLVPLEIKHKSEFFPPPNVFFLATDFYKNVLCVGLIV